MSILFRIFAIAKEIRNPKYKQTPKTWKGKIKMRFTQEEKELMFEILDNLTDRTAYYEARDSKQPILWNMFKKLRLELKGY